MEKRSKEETHAERNCAACAIAGVLLAATLWTSPSAGLLLLAAFVVCAAVCGLILLVASVLAMVERTAAAAKAREEIRGQGERASGTASA